MTKSDSSPTGPLTLSASLRGSFLAEFDMTKLSHRVAVWTCLECHALVEEQQRNQHVAWHRSFDPAEGESEVPS